MTKRPEQQPAPTPPAAAYTAPAGAHFCCGKACPGLPYSPTERAHPSSCLSEAQRVDMPDPAGRRDNECDRNELVELVNGLLGMPASRGRAPLRSSVAFPTKAECDSLAFCFCVALEHDHGGARRLRSLLYAWHNARELGGFDFADLWSLDDTYRGHALTVINMIARSPQGWYAEHYGYAADMAAIVDTYGPHR